MCPTENHYGLRLVAVLLNLFRKIFQSLIGETLQAAGLCQQSLPETF